MSTRRFTEEREYGNAKGLDTTSPVSMVHPGFVREANNTNLGTTGGYDKRGGITSQLTTPWNLLSIRRSSEFRYLNVTGEQVERIFFGTDNSTDSRIGKEVEAPITHDTSITDIKTGLSGDDRADFVQLQGRLFLFNGDSTDAPLVYEGASGVRDLGLAAPSTAPVLVAANDPGAELVIGHYVLSYTYVLYNKTTGIVLAESNPSALETVELVAGTPDDNRIEATVVGSGVSFDLNVFEPKIRIYRTVLNGSILFLDTEITDTAGSHVVNLDGPDAALEYTQLSFNHNQLAEFTGYSNAKYPAVARNRLFVAHNDKNEVRFSTIGQDGPMPESFPAVSYSSVEGKRGSTDTIVGLGVINGVPIILKDQSIGKLEEIGLPSYTHAEDAVTYVYREISDNIGAVNHFAHTQVFHELVFLSRNNVYATDGVNIRPIGGWIDSLIRSLDFTNAKDSRISMINDSRNKRVYIQVFTATTAAEPSLTLVGDYEQYPDFRWTTYNEGTNATTHPGVRSGCFMEFTNARDGSLEVYFGNTDKNGQYYKLGDGTADIAYEDNAPAGITMGDELGIFFRITTRPYDMEQPLHTKLFKNTRAFIEVESSTYQVTLCSVFDLSPGDENCQLFTIPGSGGRWEDHGTVPNYVWADTDADPLVPGAGPDDVALVWSGSGIEEIVYDTHRKAKFMQLVFKQYDKDAPVTLLGWGVSGAIFGGI